MAAAVVHAPDRVLPSKFGCERTRAGVLDALAGAVHYLQELGVVVEGLALVAALGEQLEVGVLDLMIELVAVLDLVVG
ncbi:hypothetical protein [Krasilnikovia sp. MM14-A1004]|uniref:hypothetical protein n=1 Tax=Krasilnikovia sp. MM14-A1004 TaxID=3373541 RepID=UPI00399C7FFC